MNVYIYCFMTIIFYHLKQYSGYFFKHWAYPCQTGKKQNSNMRPPENGNSNQPDPQQRV